MESREYPAWLDRERDRTRPSRREERLLPELALVRRQSGSEGVLTTEGSTTFGSNMTKVDVARRMDKVLSRLVSEKFGNGSIISRFGVQTSSNIESLLRGGKSGRVEQVKVDIVLGQFGAISVLNGHGPEGRILVRRYHVPCGKSTTRFTFVQVKLGIDVLYHHPHAQLAEFPAGYL